MKHLTISEDQYTHIQNLSRLRIVSLVLGEIVFMDSEQQQLESIRAQVSKWIDEHYRAMEDEEKE